VVLLSPELSGFTSPRYGDFSSGSVLRTSLADIVAAAARAPSGWIAEYLSGVEACRDSCPYFGFCGGAHAANRYFERGRFDVTQTEHCRNSKIFLLEGILDHARHGDARHGDARHGQQRGGDAGTAARPTDHDRAA
jgi:uncharacterized protein